MLGPIPVPGDVPVIEPVRVSTANGKGAVGVVAGNEMDRRCWMLILSFVVSVPGVIGMACQSKEQKASEKAAFKAIGGLRDGSTSATGEANFDAMIQNADSPELKKFAEEAKAKASQENDLKELGEESSGR